MKDKLETSKQQRLALLAAECIISLLEVFRVNMLRDDSSTTKNTVVLTEPAKRPARLFRYYSPVHSHIFAGKKLWFSAVTDFNDIFEVVPRFDKLIPELLEENLQKTYPLLRLSQNESYKIFKERILNTTPNLLEDLITKYSDGFQEYLDAHYKILCFSEHLDSLLMWGHYTNCHRGFVIEFDPNHALFSPRDFGKVIYENERPVACRNADARMLLCKSPEWEYEDEHRLIKLKTDLTPGKYLRFEKEVDGYFIPLPMDAVKAVYFGCRILADDRNNLLKPLQGFPHIKRFFMRRNQIEYKLDPTPFKG